MLAKGQKVPLLYTPKARHRVLTAISWDISKEKVKLMDKIRKTDQQYDLDISCYVYDEHGEYIDFVGAMAQDSMDQSGAIYHSGDDQTGEGDGDDEAISCELAGLPEDVAHIVFLVEIRSAHIFSDIGAISLRIADGMTDKNLYELTVAKNEGHDSAAYVAARIYRDSSSPTGWSLHIIDEYPDLAEVDDWGGWLIRYL